MISALCPSFISPRVGSFKPLRLSSQLSILPLVRTNSLRCHRARARDYSPLENSFARAAKHFEASKLCIPRRELSLFFVPVPFSRSQFADKDNVDDDGSIRTTECCIET